MFPLLDVYRRGGRYDSPYDFTTDTIGDSVSGLKRSIDAVGSDSANDTITALVDSIQKVIAFYLIVLHALRSPLPVLNGVFFFGGI